MQISIWQLARIAKETSQPIAMLAAQSVISNLPPSVEDALPELRAELLVLQTRCEYCQISSRVTGTTLSDGAYYAEVTRR